MNSTEPIAHNFLVIYDLHNDLGVSKILLKKKGAGYTLPQIKVTGEDFYYSVAQINNEVKNLFGLEVYTLRCLYNQEDSITLLSVNLYVQELVSPLSISSIPDGYVWVTASELHERDFTDLLSQIFYRMSQDWEKGIKRMIV